MKFVDFNIEDEHAMVRLNRPEKRNAFHPQMIQELTDVFNSLKTNENIRAVVLMGKGESFCAGADLQWMKSMAAYSEAENLKDSEQLFEMFKAVYDCPHVVISVVQGHAMGGATGLVAVSDLALAYKDCQFAFSEVKLGLVPAVISPFVRLKMTGASAQRFMLTGERFDGGQALQAGLVQFVGANQAEVSSELERLLKNIYSNGPEAMRETKKLLRQPLGDWNLLKSKTTQVIAARRVSAEGQAGLQGFLTQSTIPWQKTYSAAKGGTLEN